jgi:hypothetical protein
MPKKSRAAVTYDTVRRIALAFPDVEDGFSYGTPALKVKGQLFVRLRPDLDSVVVKTTFDRRDELMAAEPEIYYITDHYLRYPWILVRLAAARAEALPELLREAYAAALPPVKRRRA